MSEQPPNPPYGPPTPPPPPPGGSGYATPGHGAPGYGAPGYGGPAYATSAYGAPGGPVPGVALASWIQRVGAYFVDALLLLPGYVLIMAGSMMTDPATQAPTASGALVVLLGVLFTLGFSIWNTFVRQGRTGWSLGKQALGIRLLSERTWQPIGAGLAFVRQLAHILDTLACYLGWLWPLWDSKRQTFADKVMTTVVIVQRHPRDERGNL